MAAQGLKLHTHFGQSVHQTIHFRSEPLFRALIIQSTQKIVRFLKISPILDPIPYIMNNYDTTNDNDNDNN